MNEFLIPLTADGFRKFRHDPAAKRQAVADASQLAGVLKNLFHITTPLSMLMMAQRQYPDATMGEAVKLALEKAKQAVVAVKENQAEHKAVMDAERARLAPAMSRASKRVFAILEQIKVLQGEKSRSVGEIEAKRKKMADAGVPKEDVDRLTPAFDVAGVNAQIQGLKAEQAGLEAFIASGDDNLLPDGFVLVESLQLVRVDAQ
ncbi:MAG: hypothetical protein K2W93_17205 [Burkholderiaceae bacterium]|nr:hypothetical protein [Burkholderiaceae bacterium]